MPAVSIKELWVRLCTFLPDGGLELCDPARPSVVMAGVGDGIRRALTCDEDVAELVDRRGGTEEFVEIEVRPLFPEAGARPCVITMPIVCLCRPGGKADDPMPPAAAVAPTRFAPPPARGRSAPPRPRPKSASDRIASPRAPAGGGSPGGGSGRFRRRRLGAPVAAEPAPSAAAQPAQPAQPGSSPRGSIAGRDAGRGGAPAGQRQAAADGAAAAAAAPPHPSLARAPDHECLAERLRALPESVLMLPQAARVRPGVRREGHPLPSPPTALRHVSPPASAETSPCARQRLGEGRRVLAPEAIGDVRTLLASARGLYDGNPGQMHDEAWQHRAGELSSHLMEAVGLREQYEHLRYESSRRRVALEWLLRTRDTVPGPYSLHLQPKSGAEGAPSPRLDSATDAGPQVWEQGEFWPVRARDVPRVQEAIEKLHLMEGTAAIRLQDQAVFTAWRVTNARRRMAEEQQLRIGGLLLMPRRVLLESQWLKFGEFGRVAFRIYPAGDATAQPGNTTVFIWMEHPPGLSFTFNLRIGETLSTAPRLWQATMIHYRMDLRWSQLSSALATGQGEPDELSVVLQVLQWHGPEENPADSADTQQTSVTLALEMLQGAAGASMAALAEHGALSARALAAAAPPAEPIAA